MLVDLSTDEIVCLYEVLTTEIECTEDQLEDAKLNEDVPNSEIEQASEYLAELRVLRAKLGWDVEQQGQPS